MAKAKKKSAPKEKTTILPQVYVIDTETTGFKEPVVPIQFAYVRLVGLDPRTAVPGKAKGDSFSAMFNPGRDIEYGAMAAHGITKQELIDAQPWSDFIWTAVPDYIVGHSVDYDFQNIKSAMFIDESQPNPRRIDTVGIARLVFKDVDSHKQGALAYYLYESDMVPPDMQSSWLGWIKGAHEAVADVMICTGLARVMAGLLGVQTWAGLWDISEICRVPTVMPFGKDKDMPIKDSAPDYRNWMSGLPSLDPYLKMALGWDRNGKRREERGEWDKHQAAVDRIMAAARGEI